jgi:hypothetical protein
MAEKLGVDRRRPGGVPTLSAYAHQRSVSLHLAEKQNGAEIGAVQRLHFDPRGQ